MSRFYSFAGVMLAFAISLLASRVLAQRLGLELFAIVLAGLFVGSIYSVISFRNLVVPFILFLVSVGFLRFVWYIKAPILPDLYFDRIMMIWLTIVFFVKLFAERNVLKGPYRLDLFILAHGALLMVRVLLDGGVQFHTWTMSILTPYAAYFFAKNVIQTRKQIHVLMLVLLAMSIYYNITSVAEKFHIGWLLYPHYMIEPHHEFVGRSTGPFRNSGIFGNALGMLLPVHLYFIANSRRNPVRVLVMLSMAVGFAGLYFSYTRGSWLAGIAGLAAVAILNRKHYLRILLPLVILVPVVALFFLNLGQDQFMKERVENDDTIGSRIGTQITALRVWKDYPLFGCGSFRYEEFRSNYIQPINVPYLGTIRFVQFRNNPAHDMYLGPLAEDGLVGMGLQFTIYSLIIGVVFKKFRWREKGDHFAVFMIPFFAGIVVNYLVGGLTISYRHTSILGTLFYMAAGIVYGHVSETPEPAAPQAAPPEGKDRHVP